MLHWPLEGLPSAEEALDKRDVGLREYALHVAQAQGLQESSWTGAAAEAARGLASAHVAQTAVLADSAQSALESLREYHAGASALKASAQEIDAAARSHGLMVREDGSVVGRTAIGLYTKTIAQRLTTQAQDVLTQTDALDARFAADLARAQRLAGKAKGESELATQYGGTLTPEQLQAVLKQDATEAALFIGLTNPQVDPNSPMGRETQFALEHPGETAARVNELVGELSGLEGKDLSAQDVYQQLAQLYSDTGKFHLAAGQSAPTAATPPRTVKDLLQEPWSATAPPGGDPSRAPNVAVRKIVGKDGKTSYILNIGGQRVDETPDQAAATDLNDLGVSLRGLSGQESWYQKAAEQALLNAGAKPTDPVLISGVSQGGIVAAEAAADWVREGKFNVTNVITEASPTGLADIPSSVQVLSLENVYDIIPQLDGRPNPVTPNWTTLTFADQQGSVIGNHSANPQYANAQDALADPSSAINKNTSVRTFEESLAKNGFTTGAAVQTTSSYLATRDLDSTRAGQ